jgi:TPR repeat protein
MKLFRLCASCVLLALNAGCMAPMILGGVAVPAYVSSPAMETAQQQYDASGRDDLKLQAEAGDRIAQFDLAESFCCQGGGPLDRISVYDNELATEWYCKAAHQDYEPAQLRLARIYSGYPLSGLRLTQRLSALLGKTRRDMPTALMWAELAARHGDDDARVSRDWLSSYLTPEQRSQATALLGHWQDVPCRWSQVFAATGKEQTGTQPRS